MDHTESEADAGYRGIAKHRLQHGQFDVIIITNTGNSHCAIEEHITEGMSEQTKYYQNIVAKKFPTIHRWWNRKTNPFIIGTRDMKFVLQEYLARRSDTVVAYVDGSDIHGCHFMPHTDLPFVDLHFVRETSNDHTGHLVQRPETSFRA